MTTPDEAVELDYRPAARGHRSSASSPGRASAAAWSRSSARASSCSTWSRSSASSSASCRSIRPSCSGARRCSTSSSSERTKELEESYEKLKSANRQALFGLAEAIEAKDPYTKGHCGRVAAYALVLAREAGYPDDGLETLEFGAFLHDIGKIGIRDAVLLKPGPLDEAEWMHMREHPVKGYEIASKIEMLKPIMPAVRNHHERWDGSGYPDKMKDLEIPLSARIVAIADAYDAMATDRPTSRRCSLDECESILRKTAGKMYDPDLIEVFVSHNARHALPRRVRGPTVRRRTRRLVVDMITRRCA